MRILRWIGAVVLVAVAGLAAFILTEAPNPPPPPEPAHPADLPVKTLQANGLEFSYVEAGKGPLVLLLHGFPDSAWTWDDTVRRLGAEGYHAVAPFTRGYYPTQIPADGDYSLETLAKDAIAIIDALGAERAVIVGHDWGASTTYVAANLAPEKVRGIVTLAIPHPRVTELTFSVAWNFPHFIEFQFGEWSEWYARRNNYAYVEHLYHYWSPSWQVPPAQVAQMRSDYSRPGRLRAALAYYQGFRADGGNAKKVELYRRKTTVPSLVLVGEEDVAWRIGMFEKIADGFSGPFEMATTPGAGHFLQREKPAFVNDNVLRFLRQLDAPAPAPQP